MNICPYFLVFLFYAFPLFFCYLASFWEYRLDNLRVFFGFPTASLGMSSSVYK